VALYRWHRRLSALVLRHLPRRWPATRLSRPWLECLEDRSLLSPLPPLPKASPSLAASPPSSTVTLGITAPTLTDTATLSGGSNATGTITFTLSNPGGTAVDTETVAVNGNGVYTTPTGYTLPGTGTVTGAYQWDVAYSGDANNNPAGDSADPANQVTVTAAAAKFSSNAEPTSSTLDGAGAPTLKDAFTLVGGYHPTGIITFTLYKPGGVLVDTETVTVSGNGTYVTPAGYTLPTTGTVTGTYQWDATYSGDGNNLARSDSDAASARTMVLAASPLLATTPGPESVTLGSNPVTLTDTADLEGGHAATGILTFTLDDPNGKQVDTETVTVHGNGLYTTPAGYTLPSTGTVTGTYQWDATYSGDGNNNPAGDSADPAERVTVSQASPTLTTTPNATNLTTHTLGTTTLLSLGTVAPTLTDTATLAGGYFETGTITFTLYYQPLSTQSPPPPPTLVDTETVTVHGNGTYTTPNGYTLPATGTVVIGFYQWDATYSGDGDNKAAGDNDDPAESMSVFSAFPTLTTTPNATTITLGPTAPTLTDTATLADGYFETGTLTFKLYDGSGVLVDTETVSVNGNGTYTTPNGYTLPTTGTVVGLYRWAVTYSGDGNNNPASDSYDYLAEEVTVKPANPTITTTPNVTRVPAGSGPVTLTDTADLEGGYFETGVVTFTLWRGPAPATLNRSDPNLLDFEQVPADGNGSYTTPTGYTLPAGATPGLYQWAVSYDTDSNNNAAVDHDNPNEQVWVVPADPTLTTTPSPAAVTLGTPPPVLTDTAMLTGGLDETGTITFTLSDPTSNVVDTETVAVNGDGDYTTPTGYKLPTTGTVTGIYQWDVSYSGDGNNAPVSDTPEQVTVSQASPTLTTTPNLTAVTLGTPPPTLTDTATLAGGYFETGTITFTLYDPNGKLVDTEPVPVHGNGTYVTPIGFSPLPGTVGGTYQWDATYGGDANNATAGDVADPAERVLVGSASPVLMTTPNTTSVTLGTTAPTLTDTAYLEGGANETGTLTFTLYLGSTKVDTEAVAVHGIGTYTTPTGYTLPTTGTVTGTYQWDVSYSGDPNNAPASDTDDPDEQVTVAAARPTFALSPNPTAVTLGTTPPTLTATATLTGGYFETGTITFRLYDPNDNVLYFKQVPAQGNGTYTMPTGYTLPTTGTVTGTYYWEATYSGDGNNFYPPSADTFAQVTVSQAGPTITTTPNPATVAPGTTPTLTDTATLTGGYFETGTITFTLDYFAPSDMGPPPPPTLVDTEKVTVNGNGSYTTPTGYTVPAPGMAPGTYYRWDATYSGDGNNALALDTDFQAELVVSPASPTLTTTPDPTTVMLGPTTTLTDTATLSGGSAEGGTLTFTLYRGSTLVDTETVTVYGDGTYTTPHGYTLPATVPAAGTYQWDASYSGNAYNNPASDNNDPKEQVTVSQASPSLTTTPNLTTLTLGVAPPPPLTDTATLTGGYDPAGSITFTLYLGGTKVDTETVSVHGNGLYTTPTDYSLPTTGTAAGSYQWDATYSGDANNATVSDTNDPSERVVVTAAGPKISTTAEPTSYTLDGAAAPTLTDAFTLDGGYHPTGSITFTLYGLFGLVDTETVTVSGNGTYRTPTGYTPPLTGTYQWDATYSGDANNAAAGDNNATSERTAVLPASPLLVTTPSPTSVSNAGAGPITLTDTADLEGGFDPINLTFTLYNPSGVLVDTESVTVHGNGIYTTPTGYKLPSTGTVAGTYQWDAISSGDSDNFTASDNSDAAEQVLVASAGPVTPPTPSLTTTPNPTRFTPGAATPTLLTDTAYLDGGLDPTGSITFTLYGPGNTLLDTETVTVNGDGTYTTPTGYTLPADPSATLFQWDATYSGDAHNSPASDNNDPDEQVTAKALPTLTTFPSPDSVTPGTATGLYDIADLEGGDFPTGTITFTLYGPGGTLLDTEKVPVTGGGLYSTVDGYALPATAAAGIYQWDAVYNGDNNNLPATDNNNPGEQVSVSAGPVTVSVSQSPVSQLPVAGTPTLPPVIPGTVQPTTTGGNPPAAAALVAAPTPSAQPPVVVLLVSLPIPIVANAVITVTPGFALPPPDAPPTPRYLWPLGGSDKAYPPDSLGSFADLMGVDEEIEPTLRPPLKPIKNVSSLLDADDNVRLAETILNHRATPAAAPADPLPPPGGMPPEEQQVNAALPAAEVTPGRNASPTEGRGPWTAALWLTGLGMAASAGLGLLWRCRRDE
jgi:hypothetical protein